MGKQPTISVIIPLSNVAWCISTQLDALSKQDYKGAWELVLVDNGSLDETIEIVRSQTSAFPVPVKLIIAEVVAGSAHARNRGIEEAIGELICFCDADDRVDPRWISDLVQAHKQGSIVAGSNRTWNGYDTPNMNRAWCSAASSHLGGPPIAMGCNMLVSKEGALSIGCFDTSFVTGQDAEFSWKYQTKGGSILQANGAFVDYRERSGIIGNFLRNFQYGVDDITLMRRYAGIFTYDKKVKTHPRYKPPVGQVILGLRTRKSGGLVHAARVWGKYMGHLVGKIRYESWIRG